VFLLQAILPAFGLVLMRTSALILSSPILGFGTGFSGYKVGLIFILSAVIFFAVGAPMNVEFEPVLYGVLALREILIGVFLGFFLQLILLAVRVAGEMIGHEMGFMVARQVDPATGVQSSLVTNLYENLFLLALLMLNGHHWLIRALNMSFARAPVGELRFSSSMRWRTPAVRLTAGD